MSITFLSHPIHLPDFFKFDREYLGKQESQNEDQKVFHKDTLEVSQLSKNREILMDKIKHTVVQSAASLSDMRAGILKEIREEKGQYGYSDVVNACGLSYARLYSEIEQRYENEQYYKVDGTPLTKEDEIPSKGKSTRTQTEFVSEIKKLAQKAANAPDKTEQDAISRQVLQLRAEYLSEVAPDRKQLYQQAKSAMKNQNTNQKCKGIGELTLLDFLEQAEGKNQNLADKQIALAGGGTLKFTILTSGGYGVQIQSQGVNVLLNTGAGWGYEMTPAELTKKDEFYSIYWKEYNAVKNGMNSELKELPDYLEKRPVFEAKA